MKTRFILSAYLVVPVARWNKHDLIFHAKQWLLESVLNLLPGVLLLFFLPLTGLLLLVGSPVQHNLYCKHFFVKRIRFRYFNTSITLTSVFTCLIISAAWCTRSALHWFRVRASAVTLTFFTSFPAARLNVFTKIYHIYEPIDHSCTEPNIQGNSLNTQRPHSWLSPAASIEMENCSSSLGGHQRIWRRFFFHHTVK